ncbi:MAG: RtcB family protein [Dehalococcoidia bacterium]|nr:RtcB family protein [Dehalococcoidia bacterium]
MPEVKNWASILDEKTRLQAEMLSRSAVIAGHFALMPDAHLGMGATVGSVIPTKGAVVPAAVGVDIGCGMIAVETSLSAAQLPDSLSRLHDEISRSVPAGIGRGGSHREPSRPAGLWMNRHPGSGRVQGMAERACSQLGTLGSGNHFIEVCLNETDTVWVVIHSGSRGAGNRLAMEHIRIAKALCQGVPLEDKDLAYLQEGLPEFDAYIRDMLWAQEYALENREQMMNAVLNQLFRITWGKEVRRINCHHNFTQRETHFGQEVWVTRKGAIDASHGKLGVVPGSMGTRSYITEGLGNPDSYNSSSHGAGRTRSRTAAKKQLSVDGPGGLRDLMAGKAWNEGQAEELLDEHPGAYKDIDQVMEDQKDLCRAVHVLRQVLNFKGT